MGKSNKKKPDNSNTIALNRNARFNYELTTDFEAGLSLEGWEVKSIRQGKAQIAESYVILKRGELFLFGAVITPLISASSHKINDPTRTRKLLLNSKEIKLIQKHIEQKGYAVVPVKMYWSKKNLVKLRIALGRGKSKYDKRTSLKDRDVKGQLARLTKTTAVR